MALKDKLMTLEDFKAVRDVDVASNSAQFTEIKADLDALEPGLSDDAKAALLACFRHVARWDDSSGRAYYNNLYASLYPDLVPVSISAAFSQGQAIVYDTDNLAVLRQYLIVTATMAGGTTETVTDYTLSGTLTSGTSTITVTYQTKTTTFTVSVTHDDSPNISTGEIIQGYYFNASGGEVSGANSILNREYFPVSPNTTYTWVQGFQGNYRTAGQELLGACNTYRICYYTSDKTFISREVNSWYSTTWEYIEPRYYSFTTPSDAAYIRVSCSMLPIGKIYRAVPSYMYAVTLLLAYQDDSTITSKEDLFERVSIFRNGVNITAKAMRDNVVIDDSLSIIPPYWRLAAFNCNSGGTPEEGNQTETNTRMFNDKTFLLEAGDVITFNNVKYGVRCENVGDSTVLHTSAWVTDNSDYIVGV